MSEKGVGKSICRCKGVAQIYCVLGEEKEENHTHHTTPHTPHHSLCPQAKVLLKSTNFKILISWSSFYLVFTFSILPQQDLLPGSQGWCSRLLHFLCIVFNFSVSLWIFNYHIVFFLILGALQLFLQVFIFQVSEGLYLVVGLYSAILISW